MLKRRKGREIVKGKVETGAGRAEGSENNAVNAFFPLFEQLFPSPLIIISKLGESFSFLIRSIRKESKILWNIVQSGCIRKIGACRPTYPIRIDSTSEAGIQRAYRSCEDTLSFRNETRIGRSPALPEAHYSPGLSIFHSGRAEEDRGWPPGLKNERRGRGLISRQKVAPCIRDDLLPPASLRIADSCRGSLSDYFISIRRSAKPRTSFTPLSLPAHRPSAFVPAFRPLIERLSRCPRDSIPRPRSGNVAIGPWWNR